MKACSAKFTKKKKKKEVLQCTLYAVIIMNKKEKMEDVFVTL